MKRKFKWFGALSAAAVMAMGFTAMTYAAGWDNSTGQWRYLDRDGIPVVSEWKQDGGYWFYLGDDGNIVKNSIIEDTSGSKTQYYYVNADGAMSRNTWRAIAMDDSDYGNGDAQYWWYYFGADGKAYTSSGSLKASDLKTINGQKYAFTEEGHMMYGWINSETPEQQDNDDTAWQTSTYFFNGWNDGHLQTGWKQLQVVDGDGEDHDYWFYFGTNGKKYGDGEAKAKKINGYRYHFADDGHMMEDWILGTASEWPEERASGNKLDKAAYLKDDGAERKNRWVWAVPEEKWLSQDYNNEDYSWWYFNQSGKPVYNQIKKIHGRKYAFDKYGRMLTGMVKLDGGEVISFDGQDREDRKNLDEFTRNEYMEIVQSLSDDVKLYYFNEDAYKDGSNRTGYQNIDLEDGSYQFYFDTNSGEAKTGYNSKIRKFTVGGLVLKPSNEDDNDYAFIKGIDVQDGKYVITGDVTVSTDFNDAEGAIMVNKAGSIVTKKNGIRDINEQYYNTDKYGVVTDTFEDHDSYKDWLKTNK
ncbi:MAG: hypothetical protein E7232_06990 [Lachnospiraceae bacterium]|nr:hypothetical protein [Lachnospiraceae bacterium]